MVINSSDKSPFEICDSTGKEFKEIYDNVGNLLFKNWNELQGGLPLTFGSHSDYLKDYHIYGNAVQDGTPTPETPAEVRGCGERTANLINIEQYNTGNVTKRSDGSYYANASTKWSWCIPTEIGKKYCVSVSVMSTYKNNTDLEIAFCKGYRPPYTPDSSAILAVFTKNVEANEIHTRTFKFTATDEWLTIDGMQAYIYAIMINEGSAALTYEPYGYKIPVTVSDGSNAVTTPVYIGSEPLHKIGDYADYVDFERGVVVRRIKKIILRDDGLLNFYNFRENTAGNVWRCDIPFGSVYGKGVFTEISNTIPRKSSHFSPGPFSSRVGGVLGSYSNYLFCPVFSLSTIGATGETDSNIIQEHFLNWLDAQYEAGTPVNVWYALAEPKEEPIENLLPIQTIRGQNILTVDTTVQPSEMYIKYRR